MKKWVNNSKKGMAAFAAVAVMLVAGWQFGVSGTEVPFSASEVALEKAIAGSGYGGLCCQFEDESCNHPIGLKFADSYWYGGYTECF
ncbi:hypothetical protein SAMN05192553_11416 [Cyclobacterium xiamenense]|uniref:NVEALA protein n=1 Tax=Cyclobacterium xiamenense TaxID=1297121 RepID=A0A1H7BPW7_9BACT|nr:hypothetical protein [Cyclobacterium xiamenense]SEJ79753.1 hypothetical protein SAMN05192553_11416 [Cyclobacterium xiamenense]